MMWAKDIIVTGNGNGPHKVVTTCTCYGNRYAPGELSLEGTLNQAGRPVLDD
jgi:hypothetical protein